MPTQQPLPPKKEVALALLERSSVHVHLDPRAPAVLVPQWFKNRPQLVLQIGLNMPVPIPDLYLDDTGMSCTLSFNRAPFHCVVPWASVFAMVGDDGRGMVWPDDLPPEVARPGAPEPRGRAPGAQAGVLASVPERSEGGSGGRASPERPRRIGRKPREGQGPESADPNVTPLSAAPSKRPRRRPRDAARPQEARVVSLPRPEPRPAAAPGRRPPAKPERIGAAPAPAGGAAAPPAPSAPAASSTPASPPPQDDPPKGGKRRELPPYLRVVK